jgi:hypothetical protein
VEQVQQAVGLHAGSGGQIEAGVFRAADAQGVAAAEVGLETLVAITSPHGRLHGGGGAFPT